MPRFSFVSLCLLAILLPVQTILVQLFINVLNLPIVYAFWKEILVVGILFDLSWHMLRIIRSKQLGQHELIKASLPFWLVLAATAFIAFTSLGQPLFSSNVYVTGFRFELWWVWFFAITATWLQIKKHLGFENTQVFMKYFTRSLMLGFVIVALLTTLTLVFGQSRVLEAFGFGTSTTQYVVAAPLCHVIDYGSNDCRLSGTFSTPNHFAGYLLLIIPVLVSVFLIAYNKLRLDLKNNRLTPDSMWKYKEFWKPVFYGLASILAVVFLFLTYSRFALLGVFTWLIIPVVLAYKYKLISLNILKLFSGLVLAIPLLVAIIGINLPPDSVVQYLPKALAKPSSTIEHYRHSMASIEVLRNNPEILKYGLGLGNSGPAAKPEYQNLPIENALYINFNRVTYNWYIIPERITIPENWYLQLVLNGGLIYALLYITLLGITIANLAGIFTLNTKDGISPRFIFSVWVSLAFLGIIMGNTFLHLWENQTISLYWTLLYVWSVVYPTQKSHA